jgi:hypothetical protein
LIRYRPFRNSDPPALAEVWRSQPPLHRLAQPMSADLLEQYIFAKTYFDPEGLIVATEGARPVGFVHAGFGPCDQKEHLDRAHGVICRLLVGPHAERGAILSELLSAAEDYLSRSGAEQAVVGNSGPFGPFYLGLYGSSRLVGVLKSDTAQLDFFLASGYQPFGNRVVMQRTLAGFRPPVDRDQVRHRKLHEVVTHDDPLADNWWEACATSHLERSSFELIPKCGGPVVASVMTAQLHPLGKSWGVHAAGFEDVAAVSEAWQNGAATFLLAETMKTMQSQGAMLMEAVIDDSASPLGRVLSTLGFREVDRGVLLRKDLSRGGAGEQRDE